MRHVRVLAAGFIYDFRKGIVRIFFLSCKLSQSLTICCSSSAVYNSRKRTRRS